MLLLCLFACLALARTQPVLSVQPRHVHLSLGKEQGSLTVTWSTLNTTDSLVEVSGCAGSPRHQVKYSGSSQLFIDGGALRASQWVHKVSVTGLPVNTTCTYRAGSSLGWSDLMIMRTVRGGQHWDPHIVMFGDMGNENAVSLPWIQRETEEGELLLL